VVGVEQWAEIRRLHFVKGLSQREIRRRTGLHRDTIRKAINSSVPPVYRRAPAGSKLDPFKDEIHRLLREDPKLPGVRVRELLEPQKYPRWSFDWNLELTRFSSRVSPYAALLDDRYPSTDEAQSLRLDMPYPDARTELNRWLPLVKWLLAIPHYIVLVFLWIAAIVCIVLAWFAILFTGRYPRELFKFVVGVGRWSVRVTAYAFLLVTDRYPPFSLEP
jgi:hypothetical protein